MHCKKGHQPNSPWPGIIKLFPARESLINDIPAGDGKNYNIFYSTIMTSHLIVDSKTEAIYHMRSKFGM
jgi:hypothetical protein